MKLITCICLVTFAYAAQADDNIFEIRTKQKANPVIISIDRAYDDIKSKSIRSSSRAAYQLDQMKAYVKTLKSYMASTESIIIRTLESSTTNVQNKLNLNPTLDLTKCNAIINKIREDVSKVKSDASECFKKHEDTAYESELYILKVADQTLTSLRNLRDETEKCGENVSDITEAFKCVDIAREKANALIANDVKLAKFIIDVSLQDTYMSIIDACLKDKPMRAINQRLQGEMKKVKDCVENASETTKPISSGNPTTSALQDSNTMPESDVEDLNDSDISDNQLY